MQIEKFMSILGTLGVNFYSGVPDSLLSPFCDHLISEYGVSENHIVAANEGAAVGLAAGHYLATNKPAVVYMQNSGIGNAVNPICSLLHKDVYSIPAVFVIGWRGEPNTKDEPQHVFQGKITLQLLDLMEIPYVVVSEDTAHQDLLDKSKEFNEHIKSGRSVAFVIRKSALKSDHAQKYKSDEDMSREQILSHIVSTSEKSDVFVCTTGKLSREMYEIRDQLGEKHDRDFLTVGSMGHSISIAHGIALAHKQKRIYCLDGDGAILMHMGSLAVTGVHSPNNLIHIVFNNGAHETVGGIPTVSTHLNLSEVSQKLGYTHSYQVKNESELLKTLSEIKNLEAPIFIEAICNLESRNNLGRPTTSPIQNKDAFMNFLSEQ